MATLLKQPALPGPARISLVCVVALLLTMSPFGHKADAAITCPGSILAEPKTNHLYLFFPTSADSTFPDYNGNIGTTGATSPLADFDVADLASGIGTTTALRDRIHEFVVDDYCEFNVQVNKTTAVPAPTETRWQIVGVGSDSATGSSGGALFGLAQDVDTNDADAQDYGRVWADSFGNAYGGSGGALNGSNSTLERWATAIGETTAHEAAHNYGAAHGHSAPRAGSSEDMQNNHIMATGSTGLTGEIRASRNRHFSDTEYEILAHNIGLNAKTLHNWDFVNPNDTAANGMRIRLLSAASSLSVGWTYTGSRSPWQSPIISSAGTDSFQGTTYNVFNLDFTTAQSWDGATPGVVDPGAEFHTGASFTGSDAVIVTRVQLLNSGTPLPLAPRLPGYNAGAADLSTGDFDLSFFNTDPGAGDLQIRDLEIRYLPRMLDIESMVEGARELDIHGVPVDEIAARDGRPINLDDEESVITLGNLADPRSVDIRYEEKDCPKGSTGEPRGDAEIGEEIYCLRGNALSLFPATYTYIVATVVQPDTRQWDPTSNSFMRGDLESRLFYQFAGIVPDFNNNGHDDLLDIRTGRGVDDNANGVIDDVETASAVIEDDKGFPWWLLLLLIVLLLVLIGLMLLLRRRHSS